MAYCGRVLLELSTDMGTPDGRQRGTIAPEDVTRAQVMQRDATPAVSNPYF